MTSTFTTAHASFASKIAALKPGEISNYPTTEELLDVRDYVEDLAKAVDAHIAEVFAEARYMAGVGVPKGVAPLQGYLNDQSILDAFTSSAVEFPHKQAAA